ETVLVAGAHLTGVEANLALDDVLRQASTRFEVLRLAHRRARRLVAAADDRVTRAAARSDHARARADAVVERLAETADVIEADAFAVRAVASAAIAVAREAETAPAEHVARVAGPEVAGVAHLVRAVERRAPRNRRRVRIARLHAGEKPDHAELHRFTLHALARELRVLGRLVSSGRPRRVLRALDVLAAHLAFLALGFLSARVIARLRIRVLLVRIRRWRNVLLGSGIQERLHLEELVARDAVFVRRAHRGHEEREGRDEKTVHERRAADLRHRSAEDRLGHRNGELVVLLDRAHEDGERAERDRVLLDDVDLDAVDRQNEVSTFTEHDL